MSNKEFEGDAGAPLPDFTGAGNISLTTVAPALGVVGGRQQPDYLDYDQKGRGVVVTMFANTGMCYLLGITGGGVYGLQRGLAATPSSKWKVQVNSVLNHCGRFGSKAGNTLGVFAVMYSLYEGLSDNVSLFFLNFFGGWQDGFFVMSHFMIRLFFVTPSPQLELDRYTGLDSTSPPLAAAMTGITYYGPSGLRVAALGGALGLGAVGATYAGYTVLGKPFGSHGLLWF
jgi:import inner membrane translocase subunit TIM23